MSRLRRLLELRLPDPLAERVRLDHAAAIAALQGLPAVGIGVISGVELADSTIVPIAHLLGRAPKWIKASDPRGAITGGVITEERSATYDRTKVVALKAVGFGATITVDVMVI